MLSARLVDSIFVAVDTELGMQLLEINPEDYCTSELGVFVDSSSEAIASKNKIEANIQAMLQNSVKPSTIVEIIQSNNIAELKEKLKRIEQIQTEMEQQTAQSEMEAQTALEEKKKEFMEYEMLLKEAFMNAEYDRKEDIEMIRGEFNTYTFKDGDSDDDGVPDVMEVQKHRLERDKLNAKINDQNRNRIAKIITENRKIELQNKALSLKEKDMKMKAAANRKKAMAKKN